MRKGILFLLALLTVGCSMLKSKPVEPLSDVYNHGLTRLAEGDFPGADRAFRESASRCESGMKGRRALLFLALLAQDPRNPDANPDSAAVMAERLLNLPGNTLDETLEAEALYLGALHLGADPELRLDPAAPGLAVRFGDCDEPFPPRVDRPLPQLDPAALVASETEDAETGGLAAQNQTLRLDLTRQRLIVDSLLAELDTLQVELTRIRGLLRRPDTSSVWRPAGQ
jgi:hypothetical protein